MIIIILFVIIFIIFISPLYNLCPRWFALFTKPKSFSVKETQSFCLFSQKTSSIPWRIFDHFVLESSLILLLINSSTSPSPSPWKPPIWSPSSPSTVSPQPKCLHIWSSPISSVLPSLVLPLHLGNKSSHIKLIRISNTSIKIIIGVR